MSTSTLPITVTLFDPALHAPLLPSLAALHASLITSPDYMLANFLPPLYGPEILEFWRNYAADVAAGTRLIWFVTDPTTPVRSSHPSTGALKGLPAPGSVIGAVSLALGSSESEPYAASVQKLLVAPTARRRGIARLLMVELEEKAWGIGRKVLTLDTVVGTPAVGMYRGWGWREMGTIPEYGISPENGAFKDVIFFFKDLRKGGILKLSA